MGKGVEIFADTGMSFTVLSFWNFLSLVLLKWSFHLHFNKNMQTKPNRLSKTKLKQENSLWKPGVTKRNLKTLKI